MTMKNIITILVLLVVVPFTVFADSGWELDTRSEISDNELSLRTSILGWKEFDLEGMMTELSITGDFDSGLQRSSLIPQGEMRFLEEEIIRLGTRGYIDIYHGEDAETEFSQSFWTGLYGGGEYLRGDLRGELWTDFESEYSFSPRARGFMTLSEDDLEVEVGQLISWTYFHNSETEFKRDTFRARSSGEITFIGDDTEPFLYGALNHRWLQQDHPEDSLTYKWEYYNSVFLEGGLWLSDDARLSLYSEIGLVEPEDVERHNRYGANLKIRF